MRRYKRRGGRNILRAFTADFEEYQPGGDMQHAEIHIYIALK